jgi:hypothetical protein
MSKGFATLLKTVNPSTAALAVQTRALIREVLPDVVEVPWLRQKVVGYGVGPKKMSEHFCYIAFHHDPINLGFNYGAELPDPKGLLKGPGKLLRHIKVSHFEISNPPCVTC